MIKTAIKKYFHHLHYFYGYLGWRIGVSVLLSFLVGLLDGLGLTMAMPLIGMTESDGRTPQDNSTLGPVVEFFKWTGLRITLINVLSSILILFIIKGVIQFVEAYYQQVLRARFMTLARNRTMRCLSRLSYEEFVASNAGQIQNILSTEVGRMMWAISQYLLSLQTIIMTIVYVGLAFISNPEFAAMVLVGVGLTNIAYRSVYAKTRELSRSLSTSGHWYHSLLIQYVHLFKYLRATGLEKTFYGHLVQGTQEIEATHVRMGFLHSIVVGVREPLVVLTLVLVMLFEVTVLGGRVSELLLAVLFFYKALTSLMNTQKTYSGFLQSVGALEAVSEFQIRMERHRERSGTRTYPGLADQIELQDVRFCYRAGEPVVSGINLEIKKNETVAIVGESGSGKTTLVNLIVGLLKPTDGSMEIDGTNLAELNLHEYRQTIGYITQESVVFSDTVFNNVTFWEPKNEQNLAKFQAACEMAAIDKCIADLPQREDTPLGDNGVLLSGGQRQRISIAREFYRSPQILILDEATSALDSETERTIQDNIERLRGSCTIIVVAHRLSTIKAADRIVVLDRGRIVATNSFNELIHDSPLFGRMVEMQQF